MSRGPSGCFCLLFASLSFNSHSEMFLDLAHYVSIPLVGVVTFAVFHSVLRSWLYAMKTSSVFTVDASSLVDVEADAQVQAEIARFHDVLSTASSRP